jgi:hypothetical protein
MKQTAVEWLVQQLKNGKEFNDELIQQAKEMDKEQKIEAFDKGLITENIYYGYDDKKAEQYYNETFKSESYQQKMRDKIDYYKNKFKSE